MATFSERLKELRKQKGITQEELAARVGVGKQAVSQYERGIRHPDYETLGAFSDFFNVSADYMIGKTDITMRLLTSRDLAKLEKAYSNIEKTYSDYEYMLLEAYHSASDEAKSMVRFVLKLPEDPAIGKSNKIS